MARTNYVTVGYPAIEMELPLRLSCGNQPPSKGGYFHLKVTVMKTRQSICAKKAGYANQAEAIEAASCAPFPLHPYYCDRCWQFHLTGRTKGRRMRRPEAIL